AAAPSRADNIEPSSLGPNSRINGMILLGPLASRLNRIPAAVLFAYFTILLPCPFLRLPQRVIQFLMPLHCSQTAYLVAGIRGFLQFLWLSHIKLLRIVFDGGIVRVAETYSILLSSY